MSGDRHIYRETALANRRPSIEVKLPLGVRFLQPVLERLIMRLDVAEEQMDRIERRQVLICAELNIDLSEELK